MSIEIAIISQNVIIHIPHSKHQGVIKIIIESSRCKYIFHQQLMPRWKLESTDAVTSSISSRVITPSPFKSYKWNVHLKEFIWRKILTLSWCFYIVISKELRSGSWHIWSHENISWSWLHHCKDALIRSRLFHCALVLFNILDFTLVEFNNLGNLGGNPAETSLHIR